MLLSYWVVQMTTHTCNSSFCDKNQTLAFFREELEDVKSQETVDIGKIDGFNLMKTILSKLNFRRNSLRKCDIHVGRRGVIFILVNEHCCNTLASDRRNERKFTWYRKYVYK